MRTCKVEGCKNPIFGKHFCKYHYPKSIKKQSPFKPRGLLYKIFAGTKTMKLIDDVLEAEFYKTHRDEFFKKIWKKRDHSSEVSNEFLGHIPNTMNFHHILPKHKYPQAEYDEENIILLTPEEHATVELNIYKYEEINKRRIYLKLKYN